MSRVKDFYWDEICAMRDDPADNSGEAEDRALAEQEAFEHDYNETMKMLSGGLIE